MNFIDLQYPSKIFMQVRVSSNSKKSISIVVGTCFTVYPRRLVHFYLANLQHTARDWKIDEGRECSPGRKMEIVRKERKIPSVQEVVTILYSKFLNRMGHYYLDISTVDEDNEKK